MEYMPWFAWIAIAGIIAFAITQVAVQMGGRRSASNNDQLVRTMQATQETNRALLARVEQIDGRLANLETLGSTDAALQDRATSQENKS
ncbi:hypothetical protein [uncultured Arthrobacter sp.]|uniref:hypothetical protein n=1 Tax=uncultured Arthrobacter sp. TaxID=114050 RepID=UPI00260CD587|nr:hypothetical protein [uncultured Arthrobacter sp.]